MSSRVSSRRVQDRLHLHHLREREMQRRKLLQEVRARGWTALRTGAFAYRLMSSFFSTIFLLAANLLFASILAMPILSLTAKATKCSSTSIDRPCQLDFSRGITMNLHLTLVACPRNSMWTTTLARFPWTRAILNNSLSARNSATY